MQIFYILLHSFTFLYNHIISYNLLYTFIYYHILSYTDIYCISIHIDTYLWSVVFSYVCVHIYMHISSFNIIYLYKDVSRSLDTFGHFLVLPGSVGFFCFPRKWLPHGGPTS